MIKILSEEDAEKSKKKTFSELKPKMVINHFVRNNNQIKQLAAVVDVKPDQIELIELNPDNTDALLAGKLPVSKIYLYDDINTINIISGL